MGDMSRFLQEAILLARDRMRAREGGPFGALVVRDGEVIARGWNRVPSSCDPTAHAEIVAIRAACEALGDFRLSGCTIYSSCEPCPMCLGAIYWARLERLVFAATREDAARAGFDDGRIYDQIALAPGERSLRTECALRDDARELFVEWESLEGRVEY